MNRQILVSSTALAVWAVCLAVLPATAQTGNLLRNPSFEEGEGAPDGWEWSGSRTTHWRLDPAVRFAGTRSLQIIQDVGQVNGSMRQTVAGRPGVRYRLRGRILTEIEADGINNGAALFITALAAGKEVGAPDFRYYLTGRAAWRLWTCDFVTPPATDSLVVGVELRNGDGTAWFDGLELVEAPAPHPRSAPSTAPFAPVPALPRRDRVTVVSRGDTSWLRTNLLEPMLGASAVRTASAAGGATAVRKLAAQGLVLLDLESLGRLKGIAVTERTDPLMPLCARITERMPVTAGFHKGDVVPWSWMEGASGTYRQYRLASAPPGYQVLAVAEDSAPVLLWQDGVLALETAILNRQPGPDYPETLPALVISNALGRPQTTTGNYVVPDIDYSEYVEAIRALAKRHPGIRLREEGNASGLPVYSLAIGPEDAPIFFVDCGIHPYEWVPQHGALMYLERLATEYERGLPWARSLLSRLCLKMVPVYAPVTYPRYKRELGGVNLNRNFPPGWEASNAPDKGPAPLSRPEARVMAELLKRDRIVTGVNWHETSADTNWVAFPGTAGRYRKYAASVPAIFTALIDPGIFFWHPAQWTQTRDLRNYYYHAMSSFPYVRAGDGGRNPQPFEQAYVDAMGRDALLIEQLGNDDPSVIATPQRTEITARILEMLFGLQIGMVCRNPGTETRAVSLPLVTEGGKGNAVVYAEDGREVSRRAVVEGRNVEVVIPPRGVLVVELKPAPWERKP